MKRLVCTVANIANLRKPNRFQLLPYFSIASLAAFVSVTVALISLYRNKSIALLLEMGQQQHLTLTTVLSRSLWEDLQPLVEPDASHPSPPSASRERSIVQLNRKIQQQTEGLSVVKVKLFNLEGRTVFSTEPGQIGTENSHYRGFVEAKSGELVTQLKHRSVTSETSTQSDRRNLISSYVPLRHKNGTGEILGVFELYSDVTPLYRRIERVQWTIGGSVVAILALLYGLLFWLVKRADSILDRQHRDLQESEQRYKQQAETLKQVQATLVQTEKLSGLGRTIAGVAHEINNPVSFIHGNLDHVNSYVNDLLELVQLYRSRCPQTSREIQPYLEDIELDFLEEDLPKCLASMKAGTERIREIVLSLKIFSKLDRAGLKTFDLQESLESTLLILNSRLQDRIEVRRHYDRLPAIKGYPVEIGQVFANLIENAIDAVDSLEDDRLKRIHIYSESLPSQEVRVRIVDSGNGIPEEVRDRIFEPFFTTKPVGRGTGLGLSIAYEIVRKHHGRLQASSPPGGGTEFSIVLPVKQPCPERPPTAVSASRL